MATPEESLVKGILRRLGAQPLAPPQAVGFQRTSRHAPPSSLEDLRGIVQNEKDMTDLVDAVREAKSLILPRSSMGDEGLVVLIRALKDGSKHGPTLLRLDLADNGITDLGFEALTEAMGGAAFLSALQYLNVSQNRIGGGKGVDTLSSVLRTGRHSSLRVLDMSHCSIDDAGMVSFADALQSGNFSARELQSLDLSYNQFGDHGATSLGKALGRLPRLRFLNLSHNMFGELGAPKLLSAVMAGKLTGLTHLLLHRCYLSSSLLLLAQSMEMGNLPNLLALDLSRNHMRDEGSAALAKALSAGSVPRLQELSLSESGIGGGQVDDITRAIEMGDVRDLRHLDLSFNGLDSSRMKGSFALVRLIESGKLSELRYLDLSKCSIADAGLIALANRMESGDLKKLEHFLFEGNDITSKDSIKALVRALESGQLPALRELELGQTNSIGEDVSLALASGLIHSSARGPVVEMLKERLLSVQRSPEASTQCGTVGGHLSRIWSNKSFRGLESIKLVNDEEELTTTERIFNKYLERQYSTHSPPVVDENTESASTLQFLFNLMLVCAWVVAVLVSRL